MEKIIKTNEEELFSGTVYLIYTFDFGDDIELKKVSKLSKIHTLSRDWPKYLKSHHKPLTIELPSVSGTKPLYANLHHFGALSIVYHVPFKGTLATLRDKLNNLDAQYQKQSVEDAHHFFKKIKRTIEQPKFFHQRDAYIVMTIQPNPNVTAKDLREKHGSLLASTLRFETANMSQYQLEDILKSATGYYRDDLVIIDTEAAFVYDNNAEELLDFFELASMQRLELRYFDKLLDSKLDQIYNHALQKPSLKNCLPFVGLMYDPLDELSRLKVDISVITERLGNSIKTVGEVYYSEIYDLLSEKLELHSLRKAIDKKLSIAKEVRTIYQYKVNSIREDILSVLIIILIFTELIVGLIK